MFFIFFYITLVEAWNVVGGYAGYTSFGHTAFLGLSAYTVATFTKYFGISPFLIVPLGGVFASLLAILVGASCLKMRGPYFALATLCIPPALQIVFLNLEQTGAATGIWLPLLPFGIFEERALFYEIMLAITVIALITVKRLEESKFGLGLMSIRQDENVAESLGVNTTILKIKAFVLSAFITGVVGGIYAIYITYIHPSTVFDIYMSIFIVVLAIFGGRGTWIGPAIGTPILVVINEILTSIIGAEIARMIFGCMLMVFIVALPEGLASLTKYLKFKKA
jgi:branched-chain amino acid transport system permease protein